MIVPTSASCRWATSLWGTRRALGDSGFEEFAFCTGPALWRWRKFALFPPVRGGRNNQDRLL
ncbi:hypothetical protein FAZ19_01240 [Sphingobacterium alkalisoli]|uniref:Uncharacterized protein n=1 Tax=Sphingobacterium alkalisoli TaxID=1874115 RepID=A0A4U0H7U6_9SPHI|nr:hypothetical protein [Sphingobacterium alkalisoli]TJY67917.1 hypothetical protein FAZ19_01240 [Sphingobacterium alkalisoli]